MKDFFGMPWLPLNASAQGEIIDDVNIYVHVLMLVLFVGWTVYFFYVIFKFRQSAHPKAIYRDVKGHTSNFVEIGIILVEIVLLFGFSIPLWKTLANEFPAEKDSVVVRIVAEQFAWNFHYPGPDGVFGQTKIDLIDLQSNPLGVDRRGDPNAADDVVTKILHLPVEKPVIAHLTSKDVIHALGIPTMRVKLDAVPGKSHPVTFTPIKTGKFLIACSQLCGAQHATMRGFIHVYTRGEYELWYRKAAEEAKKSSSEDEAW